MTITLLTGDCRDVLSTLAERSVQCIVTSPPYYGLRHYDVDGQQIGLERTPAEYVAALVEVFRACRRVLRDDGILWLNLGDSYSGSWGNYAPGGIKNQQRAQTEDGKRWKRPAYGDTTTLPATARVPGLAEKNLIGIPWRVAFALQDDGWILRSDIIWSKPNPMPESVTDRPTRSHEYLFLFAKQARYYYDAQAIAEPVSQVSIDRINQKTFDQQTGGSKDYANGTNPARSARKAIENFAKSGATTRNRRSVWTVATRPYSGAHFAVFPEQLIAPCILAGSVAQACERCGAPWGRVIGRTDEIDPSARGSRFDQGKTGVNGAGRVQAGERFARRDLGFRPTCACDATGSARSIVLDPFVGSGTTCRVAEAHGRDSIGIDLGYKEIQDERTDGVQKVMVDLL